MNQSRLQWKVGLFVLIGLVLLAGLLLEFSKGLTFFRPTYDILLRSDTAGSLKTRAQVLISGVQIGTVADIRLASTGKFVTITLRIYSEYKVYKTAQFFIEQSGFLGDQYIAIVPQDNQGPVFHNGDVAKAEAPFNMLEVARSVTGFVKRIDETAMRLNETLIDVRQYLLNKETLTNLSVSASHLRLASERALDVVNGIGGLLNSNANALSGTGTNLLTFSDELVRFAGKLDGVLATNTPDINQAVKNIESSTAILKSEIEQVDQGKGLAGVLLKNEQIGANLSEITYNLSITSSNLNRLGLWGILWQHKPPQVVHASPEPPRLNSPKNPYEE